MTLQERRDDLSREDSNSSCSLESCASTIESLPATERWLTYQECAKCLLTRYLIARNLVEGPLRDDECRPAVGDCVAENADGICYLFYVRGNVWSVTLSRKADKKRAIEEKSERLSDPTLFEMDLRVPAKISQRNSDFRM
jgi:hypothetical protein